MHEFDWELVKSFERKLYSMFRAAETLTHVLLHPGSSNLSICQLPFSQVIRINAGTANGSSEQLEMSFNSFSAIVTESFHAEEWDSP